MKAPTHLKASLMLTLCTLLMGACTNAQEKQEDSRTEVKVINLNADDKELTEEQSAALAKALQEVQSIIGTQDLSFNLDSLLNAGDAVKKVQVFSQSKVINLGEDDANPTVIVIEDGKVRHSGTASGKTEVHIYNHSGKKE